MRDRLEIITARHAGFCMGVRRALKLCMDAVNSSSAPRPIFTLGPLIHNRQVLDVLERKGVHESAKELSGREKGTAVIRAHGISPADLERVRAMTGGIVDATCPHVSKVHKIVKKYSGLGYKCIVVGDPGHAEVEGVMSCAGGEGIVIRDMDDARSIATMDRAVVVAQTTQNAAVFEAVSAFIGERCNECLVFDTICRATQDRQNEAIELAHRAEAVVVVGGYNSANTCRLARICADTGTPVYHVESEKELPVDDILQYRRIAVTAGASTPNWMIRRVTDRLHSADREHSRPVLTALRRLLTLPIRSNIFQGGGAACMVYAAFVLLDLPTGPLVQCMALAFCFITSQHLLHQYSKLRSMILNEPERGRFFETHAGSLLALAALTAALSVVFGFMLGPAAFVLIILGTVGGLAYCILERAGSVSGMAGRLRQMTGSKEFFVAAAWATTTALIPFLSVQAVDRRLTPLAVFAVFAALMPFHRTLLTDMRDVEGDQLIGRETLAVAFNRRAAVAILLSVAPVQFLLLLVASLMGWISGVGYVMLLAPCYYMLISWLYLQNRLPVGEPGEALTDAGFYLVGLLALLGA